MKWKKKDEEEMRLKEEEYMSRRVSAANIARTKVTFRNNIISRVSTGHLLFLE